VFRRVKFDPTSLIDTLVAGNTSLTGELKCDGNLRIDGLVEGTVQCTGSVVIGEPATIRADVHARKVSVQGTIEGNVYADHVEILDGGRILGDVDTVDFLLDDGGLVRGHVTMRKGDLPELEPLVVAEESVPDAEPGPDEEATEGQENGEEEILTRSQGAGE